MSKFLRIVQLKTNSPMKRAGLIERQDFVYHCLSFDYLDLDHFVDKAKLLAQQTKYEMKLVVFNIVSEETRIVTVTENPDWRGPGVLGVVFGQGLMHNIRKIQQAMEA